MNRRPSSMLALPGALSGVRMTGPAVRPGAVFSGSYPTGSNAGAAPAGYGRFPLPPGVKPADVNKPDADGMTPGRLGVENRSFYYSSPQISSWFDPGVSGVVARCLFATTILDLRSDYKDAIGTWQTRQAFPIPRGAAYGQGARVAAQITPADGTALSELSADLEVFTTEFAHVVDPARLRAIQPAEDITADFWACGEDAVLVWSPPGNPLRFWRVQLQIDMMSGAFVAAPQLQCEWVGQ